MSDPWVEGFAAGIALMLGINLLLNAIGIWWLCRDYKPHG